MLDFKSKRYNKFKIKSSRSKKLKDHFDKRTFKSAISVEHNQREEKQEND